MIIICSFLDGIHEMPYRHPKGGIGFNQLKKMGSLIHSLMGYGRGSRSASWQEEILAVGAIRMEMGGKDLMA